MDRLPPSSDPYLHMSGLNPVLFAQSQMSAMDMALPSGPSLALETDVMKALLEGYPAVSTASGLMAPPYPTELLDHSQIGPAGTPLPSSGLPGSIKPELFLGSNKRARSRNPFETEEEKLMKKRERKRESVRKSRKKKQDRLDHLEERTKELEEERQRLLETIQKVKQIGKVSDGDSASDSREMKSESPGRTIRGCVQPDKQEIDKLCQERIKLLETAIDGLNAGGYPDFEQLCYENYDENVIGLYPDVEGEVKGVKALLNWWKKLIDSFPDCTISHKVTVEDNLATQFKVSFTMIGTQIEGIFGVLPTNKKIRVNGHAIITFKDNKIVRQVTVWNHGGLILELLGIPAIDT